MGLMAGSTTSWTAVTTQKATAQAFYADLKALVKAAVELNSGSKKPTAKSVKPSKPANPAAKKTTKKPAKKATKSKKR